MIEYSHYSLTQLGSKLNSFSHKSPREGVLLRMDGAYLDYCPWIEFGDLGVEDFLQKLKSHGIDEKMNSLFELDKNRALVKPQAFLNHHLLLPDADLSSLMAGKVYKLKCDSDFERIIKTILSTESKFRLDFNNCLNYDLFCDFIAYCSEKVLERIDYIEDPYPYDSTWSEFLVKVELITDRNPMVPNLRRVLKPNIDFVSKSTDDIFSSYMGHDLGRYHCYLYLLKYGNLALRHGVVTPNLFHNQLSLFLPVAGMYELNEENVNIMYEKLESREWLCLS